ncbi:MAG: efflux RND transporter periplasmic adaptor subunit [Deltaproteobacteria bacterium]|nr:efflux RND transporter periplasmic adaptor subunit [Deltaproteobacteria bacterium]
MSEGTPQEGTPKEGIGETAGMLPGGPPEKKKARAAIAAVIALILLGAGALAFFRVPAFHALLHPHAGDMDGKAAKGAVKFTCPMHPFIVSDKPGACPICGMTLVLQSSTAAATDNAATGTKERKILYWTDPTIPGDRSDKPGKSPMGMDRVPVYEEDAIGMVAMNPTQRLMANVATEKVARRAFVLDTAAVGKISWDERRVAKVSARIGGRVEKLHVDFTGSRVLNGQPLLDIYSPELVATQKEYLVAMAGVERMKGSPYEDARAMSSGLLSAARTRLSLWGVTDAQVADLERTKTPATVFTVFAPASGIVTERLVTTGQYVMEGAPLFSIADMNPVWVQAEIYEFEIHKVPVGTEAVVTTEAWPGKEFRGRVAFVEPFLSPETRTVRVRIELPNPGGLLKPDMFVRVAFKGTRGKELAVPDSAVLVTGERAMAWVEVMRNTFEPRMVKVGHKSNGYYEILSGLKEGDTVVTSAGFLIDSESQLKSGFSDPHAGHGGAESPPAPTKGNASPASVPGDHSGHGGK